MPQIDNIVKFYYENSHLWEVFAEMVLLPVETEKEIENINEKIYECKYEYKSN